MQNSQINTLQLPPKPSQDNSNHAVASQIGWIVEEELKYYCDYIEGPPSDHINNDLALLGRASQEVMFAQAIRRSAVDTVSELDHGSALPDEQYKEVLMFLDRISSALFVLKEMYEKNKSILNPNQD